MLVLLKENDYKRKKIKNKKTYQKAKEALLTKREII